MEAQAGGDGLLEATVAKADGRATERWDDHRGSGLETKTLISHGLTPTRGMTVGTVDIEPAVS